MFATPYYEPTIPSEIIRQAAKQADRQQNRYHWTIDRVEQIFRDPLAMENVYLTLTERPSGQAVLQAIYNDELNAVSRFKLMVREIAREIAESEAQIRDERGYF